jgi:hypothetical protein
MLWVLTKNIQVVFWNGRSNMPNFDKNIKYRMNLKAPTTADTCALYPMHGRKSTFDSLNIDFTCVNSRFLRHAQEICLSTSNSPLGATEKGKPTSHRCSGRGRVAHYFLSLSLSHPATRVMMMPAKSCGV